MQDGAQDGMEDAFSRVGVKHQDAWAAAGRLALEARFWSLSCTDAVPCHPANFLALSAVAPIDGRTRLQPLRSLWRQLRLLAPEF